MIRSLALRELRLRDWMIVFRRELLTGLLLGAFLGFIGFLRIILWQRLHFTDYGVHYLLVGATVWLSLIGVLSALGLAVLALALDRREGIAAGAAGIAGISLFL